MGGGSRASIDETTRLIKNNYKYMYE